MDKEKYSKMKRQRKGNEDEKNLGLLLGNSEEGMIFILTFAIHS